MPPDPTDPHRSVHDRRTVETESDRVWSPAQVVAGVIGLGFVVMGGVTLLRVGLGDLLSTAFVGWYVHSGILGLAELVLGVLFLGAAASAFEVRSTSVSLGVLLVAFGLIALIEPGVLSRYVGGAEPMGWTYLVAGLVSALVGMTAPLVTSHRQRRIDGSD